MDTPVLCSVILRYLVGLYLFTQQLRTLLQLIASSTVTLLTSLRQLFPIYLDGNTAVVAIID